MNPKVNGQRRILLLRLDRLGDVVLSTPVISALRKHFPKAYIAMAVRPACEDVVAFHRDLDEWFVYDKEGKHRSIAATWQFARELRRHQFDTAIVLHPSTRSHFIPWLAGIPNRIGYDRKNSWLLTRRVPHDKQLGRKHEAQYTLDLLQSLGVDAKNPLPSVAVRREAHDFIVAELRKAGISPEDKLVAVHPSASCPSKRWLPERFAQVADRLIKECRTRVIVLAGEKDAVYAHKMVEAMQQPALNLAGKLSVGQSAGLMSQCQLLLSNDSGPVHLATAVKTPVVAIFGRNQPGLAPARWGPLGEGNRVLHKDVGCEVCPAHLCTINFKCLTELSVDEVFSACSDILSRPVSASGD